MTAETVQRVNRYLAGLEHISTGPCPSCQHCEPDDTGEPFFSWHPCELCGDVAGNRYCWHGINSDDGKIVHGDCCEDCMIFLNYGA